MSYRNGGAVKCPVCFFSFHQDSTFQAYTGKEAYNQEQSTHKAVIKKNVWTHLLT